MKLTELKYGITRVSEALLEDIKKHGIVQPLIVTDDGRVIDGNIRANAARILGIEDVPVKVYITVKKRKSKESKIDIYKCEQCIGDDACYAASTVDDLISGCLNYGGADWQKISLKQFIAEVTSETLLEKKEDLT